ncbi:hypothetical protein [Sorangium sp. So ce341]|uniref:hypothetical protein n=1 Tax=Sorangium sp. So ce341 TaxID=3133302 RepID=UPI003F621D6C
MDVLLPLALLGCIASCFEQGVRARARASANEIRRLVRAKNGEKREEQVSEENWFRKRGFDEDLLWSLLVACPSIWIAWILARVDPSVGITTMVLVSLIMIGFQIFLLRKNDKVGPWPR